MAKATGTIDFSAAPALFSKLTLSDGTGDGFGQVTFAFSDTASSGRDALSGSSALSDSNNVFNGNASKALTLYANSSTNKSFMYISFHSDGQVAADFRDMATGGSTPLIYEFTDASGNVLNVTLVNESSGFTATVGSGTNSGRKDSAGNYSINTNLNLTAANIAESLKLILNAAKSDGEINITTATRDSTNFLNFRTVGNDTSDGPLKFRIKRASGSWTSTAKVAAHISKDDSASTGDRIANLSAPDEPVYSVRHAPASGGSLDATEFAAYFGATINNLPIGITATVSGTEVSLENDVEGTAGNVTITTLGTVNASVSGMSGGSASGGGGSMAKRLTISAEQIAVSSSGGLASSGDNKPALMLSLTGLTSQASAGDDDLLAIHVDGELVPKKIKVSELIASFAGGSDTQVQFNDSNALGGDAGLTYYKSSNALFVSGAVSGVTLSGSGEVAAASFKCDGAVEFGTSLIVGSASLNETDLTKLDGITDGTAAANKALVLDANKNISGITMLTASFARIDELDVVTINSVTETVNTLQIQDKLLVSALSASSAQADGGGLQVGGKQGDDSVASVLYEHTGTKMLHKIAGSTIAAVKPAGVDVTGIISGSGVATIHKVTSDGLTVNGIVSGSGVSTIHKITSDGLTVNGVVSGSGVSTIHKINVDALTAGGAVTAGSSFIIGSADLNEADLEKLDGITDGTAAANKAVVVDANKDVSGLRDVSGRIFSGSGTSTLSGLTADNATVGTRLILSGSKVGAEIATVAVANDYFMFLDGDDDGDVKKESIKDLVTLQAGSGIQATNGVFSLSHVIDRAVATASFDSDGSTKYDFLPISGTPSSDNCVSVYINGLHLSLSSSATGITDHWDYKIDSSRLVFNAGTDINVGDEIVIKYVAS